MPAKVLHLYDKSGLSPGATEAKLQALRKISPDISTLQSELCYNVELSSELTETQFAILKWILGSPQHPECTGDSSFLSRDSTCSVLIEIGPRLNFSTAFSSNAVSICHGVGLSCITRLELSTRYLISWDTPITLIANLENRLTAALHDRMTQCRYEKPLTSFALGIKPEKWFYVDVMSKGRAALEEVNTKLGLAFDDWDLTFYTDLFKNKLGRNPTSVECFDLAQSNSEHSRHWFFKGKMVIDGEEQPRSLFDMIVDTQNFTNKNNVIKFSDNSSAIEGFKIQRIKPMDPTQASKFLMDSKLQHLIFTAETHNFPTGVAPFSGATTGTGGRIRDVHAVGRGGHYIAGTAGYSFGNLHIPGYELPWEDPELPYPGNFAPPLEVAIEASNGASDYGNKFGEPVICGFARSYGQVLSSGERREYIKPIMFSGGVGALDADMVHKLAPEKGMQVVKLGGPVYRIGVGGGSASSVEVQGTNKAELDFGAVQRGDAEMEQKLHRVIRGCLESPRNPICSIHDQGAGGNGNVLKELVEPAGAVIFTGGFQLGDPTLSVLELWGAEYQENDALLCKEQDRETLAGLARRERCPVNFVGRVTGTGRVVLQEGGPEEERPGPHPVDLQLELVLGKMPQKQYTLQRETAALRGVTLPPTLQVRAALERVLRLPSVASKRYLTSKVDRCVTGLVAQQQCVGPLHAPLSDVAVVALSPFNLEGVATSIGEQPVKGLVNAAAGARMTVAEALTNLALAQVTSLRDVKCSGNWMWAAKLPGEGAALHDACRAMCELMNELGVAVDGGKDSLSMAARVEGRTVKAPGTLVVSTYAPCPDVRNVLTPDLKLQETGTLLFVDLSDGKSRLGGSALAQCYQQLGSDVPDVESAAQLAAAFEALQELLSKDKVLSAHDVSDGGLITCLLEMAFAGNCGLRVNVAHKSGSPLEVLFCEELGWVLEVKPELAEEVTRRFHSRGVACHEVGHTGAAGPESLVSVSVNHELAVEDRLAALLHAWEETSHRLELLQSTPRCAAAEFEGLKVRQGPRYKLTFDLRSPPKPAKSLAAPPRVAVLREEGINGDREMVASLVMAGFEVWDLTVQDLLEGGASVDGFRGLVFPGGFSYADVLGSAKGWAAGLLFNPSLKEQFRRFAARRDTFSLGVCNGCQLMSLLGWVGGASEDAAFPVPNVSLQKNESERFECRFSTVKIEPSPAVMLRDMDHSVLGVWVAHGEGKFTFKSPSVLTTLESNACLPIRYVDDSGLVTDEYPMNPNGSPQGIAGICSPCGRHLAMMPHPERCTLTWQWPYLPQNWLPKEQIQSPWLRMFQNAFVWASDN